MPKNLVRIGLDTLFDLLKSNHLNNLNNAYLNAVFRLEKIFVL